MKTVSQGNNFLTYHSDFDPGQRKRYQSFLRSVTKTEDLLIAEKMRNTHPQETFSRDGAIKEHLGLMKCQGCYQKKQEK